jgi:hypothetical protein
MTKQYGVNNDNALFRESLRDMRSAPFVRDGFPDSDYRKVWLKDNDSLYGVESNLEMFPNLAVWGLDQVNHVTLPISNDAFFGCITSYLANMNDDELELVSPLVKYLAAFAKIYTVTCTDHTVLVSADVGGVPRTLLLTVMNMMDDVDHLRQRDTIN